MPESIDSLQIEINAKANKANDAIDRLVVKLDRLTASLGKLNPSNLIGLANGVQRLGNAMQIMNTIKTADFTRLAKNLEKMGQINTLGLNNSASSISHLTRAFSNLGGASNNAQQIGVLVNSLSKLGSVSVQRAITNIPLLATAMNNLMTTLSKTPQVSRNIIEMTNALANLSAKGSQIGTVSNYMQNGLNRTSKSADKAKKSFGGLASAIGKFYASYFLVIRGLKGLWNSIASTTDYIEAYNYFNVSFGKIASEWDKDWEKYGYENSEVYAESFTKRMNETLGKLSGVQVSIGEDGKGLLTDTGLKNLGLNIREITQYASQLASVTNSVGQTGEVSLAAATSFTKLAGDISSLFNVDYSSVAQNIQSGLIGQSRALYKYGIDITNATLQTYAYELGLSKAVSEMTQAEKMQLRMIAILDQSKVSWGDLANTINSPSNMIRQLSSNLKEASMILGQLFTPMLQRVFPILNGLTIAIKRLLTSVANMLGVDIDFNAYGQGYNELEDGLNDLEGAYEDVANASKEWQNQLMPFDEMNKLNDSTNSGTGIYEGAIDLTDEILKASEEYEKVWQEAYNKMQNASIKWADKIESALGGVRSLISNLSIGDYVSVGEDVSKLVIGLEEFVIKAINDVDWNEIGSNFGTFLSNIDWLEIFKGIKDIVVSALEGAWSVWFSSLNEAPLETAFLTAIALWKFTKVGDAIGGKIASSIMGSKFKTSLFGAGKWIAGIMSAAILGYGLGNKIYEAITGTEAGPLDEQLKYLFDASWEEIKEAATETFKQIGEQIKKLLGLGTELHSTVEDNKFANDDFGNKMQATKDRTKTDAAYALSQYEKTKSISWWFIFQELAKKSFATGGFPEDGLFFANRGELVGKFSNGKTAVANNNQIIEGIADGIGPAVYNAVVSAMQVVSRGNGDTIINIDGKQVFRAVQRQATNYTLQTGKSAF